MGGRGIAKQSRSSESDTTEGSEIAQYVDPAALHALYLILSTSRLLRPATVHGDMSLTTDDFAAFTEDDPEDDKEVPLGDALSELAVDIDVDSVEAVRDIREQT
ncbi:hypothetical protein [Halorubrum distributum]|nr:hypothetical protein [Halorubrum arcis]